VASDGHMEEMFVEDRPVKPNAYPDASHGGMKVVTVLSAVDRHEDCGPCLHDGCLELASHEITLLVGGAECVTWLCEDHSLTWRSPE
jgi:hypothetical protein